MNIFLLFYNEDLFLSHGSIELERIIDSYHSQFYMFLSNLKTEVLLFSEEILQYSENVYTNTLQPNLLSFYNNFLVPSLINLKYTISDFSENKFKKVLKKYPHYPLLFIINI